MMAGNIRSIAALVQFTIFFATFHHVNSAYLGKFLGKLSELHHGVTGEVYAVDARTIHLKDFTYDGQGPAAYFYAGNSRAPGNGGFRLRDENGNPEVIRRYRKESVTLTLPEGKTLNNIKWFSVWCEEFAVNFGDVKIPRNFDYPRPRKIDALRGVHGISSDNVVIVDAQTLLVPNLSYDGEAPDAKFWVGRGPKPSPQGVRVADENGKEVPLRRYDKKTVVLTLPGDLTVFDIGHFGIWCEAFTVDFGHLQIPPNLNVPPSLKMLGVSPQSKLNCEVLHDDLAFEVRWAIAGDSIVLQLVAKLDKEYMSFGISGSESKSEMIGGDVVVASVDKETLKGQADDYYLGDKSQCSGPTGSCPDSRLEEKTNSVRLLNAAMVNGYSIVTFQRPLKASDQFDRHVLTNTSQAIIWAIGPLNQRNEVSFHSLWTKGDQFIHFGRTAKWNCPMPETEQFPMKPVDPNPPKEVYREVEEPITEYEEPQTKPPRTRSQQRRRGESNRGNVRQESTDNVAKDSERTISRTRQNTKRGPNPNPQRNVPRQVPTPAPVAKTNAWEIPPIQCNEPEDGVLYAQMGPTGGKRGYPAITGHVGWGISWYINGLLIPEINLVRGKTYTFVVEGGLDPEIPAKYHPFYITDDPVGGYEYKTPEEKSKVKIFAGAALDADGTVQPTGVGRLCHWTHQGDSEADDFESFGAYQRTLELKCDQGEPGVIQFTPDRNTPDTLYYQCFTHRYLGWKINVLDSCDIEPAASELKPVVVRLNNDEKFTDLLESGDDLEESPSIRVETRVKAPNTLTENEGLTKTTTEPSNKIEIQITDAPIISTETSNSDTLVLNTNEEATNFTYNNSIMQISQVVIPDTYISQQQNIPIIIQQPQSDYFPNQFYLPRPESSLAFNYNPVVSNNFKMEPLPQTNFKTNSPENTQTRYTEIKFNTAPINDLSTQPSNVLPRFSQRIPTETPENKQSINPINKTNLRLPFINYRQSAAHRVPQHKYAVNYPLLPAASMINSKPEYFPMGIEIAPPMIYKKPYQRPIRKPFPYRFKDKPTYISAMQSQIRPHVVMLKKRPHQQLALQKPGTTYVFAEKPVTKIHPSVEISPLQASTEKEPQSTTEKPYAPLIHSAPSKVHYINENKHKQLPTAVNTGFRPESIVVEGGFKPIVSKEIQDRLAEIDGPELEYESEIGVIDMNQENKSTQNSARPFEPMFVPSPIDKRVGQNKNSKTQKAGYNKKIDGVMFIIKKTREERRDVDNIEDEVAEAAERIFTYYLPPADKKVKPMHEAMQPSNIDIPPGTVVSYDGKKVSGASLTAKGSDKATVLETKGSKAAELIKLQHQKVLNRDLESPSLSYLPQEGAQGSTKLTLLKEIEERDETHINDRRKREAHHTPEHTAEQQKQAINEANINKNTNMSSATITNYSLFIVVTNLILLYSNSILH